MTRFVVQIFRIKKKNSEIFQLFFINLIQFAKKNESINLLITHFFLRYFDIFSRKRKQKLLSILQQYKNKCHHGDIQRTTNDRMKTAP